MDNKNIALLIGAFVTLLIGVSLIGVVAEQEQDVTTLTVVSNETFDLATLNIRAFNLTILGNVTHNIVNAYDSTAENWKMYSSDCDMADPSFIGNLTGVGGAAAGTLTATTDYVWNSNGTIYFVNSAEMAGFGNTTYIDYTYCADDYLTQSWTRSIADLIPGFFGIALLLISVGLLFQVLKNEGLVGI